MNLNSEGEFYRIKSRPLLYPLLDWGEKAFTSKRQEHRAIYLMLRIVNRLISPATIAALGLETFLKTATTMFQKEKP